MAFVGKSKKEVSEPLRKNNDNLGPGEYLPQTQIKKIKLYKEPFLSTINGTLHKLSDVPGPGSYYQDETLIKYLKNIKNDKTNEKNEQNNTIINEDDNLEKQNNEKLGFNSKSRRFNKTMGFGCPGPGYYFPMIKKFDRLKKLKEEELYSKKMNRLYKIKEFQLIPTIPSKNQQFGFDILEGGKLIQKQDPNMYQVFSGEKGDTVGPGNYEIENPKDWHKTGPQWSKSKEIRGCNITSNKQPKTDIQSSSSTYYSDSNLKNSNILSTISTNNNNIKDKLKNIDIVSVGLDEMKSTILNKTNLIKKNIVNSHCQRYSRISLTKKDFTPGPGFYIDRFKNSSFHSKIIPEDKQFFGSNVKRFFKLSTFNNPGPAEYFKDNKSNSVSYFAPFSTNEKRFIYSFVPKEKENIPSPFQYKMKSFTDDPKGTKTKATSPQGQFGFCQKRFIRNSSEDWKNSLPGPGLYDPEKPRKHISCKKIVNSSKYGKNNTSNENLQNYQSNHYFDPHSIFTIKYKNKKKTGSVNLKSAIFFRTNPFNKKILPKSFSCKTLKSKIGPGSYFNEKFIKTTQVVPAFHQSSEKMIQWGNGSSNDGPGYYNLDSYFDWNKKTYNINFA